MTLTRCSRVPAVRALIRTWTASRRALRVAAPRVVVAIWLLTTLNPAVNALSWHLDGDPGVRAMPQGADFTGEERWLGPDHLDGDEQDCERSVDCLLSSLKGNGGELSIALSLGHGQARFVSTPPCAHCDSPLMTAKAGPHRARAPPAFI